MSHHHYVYIYEVNNLLNLLTLCIKSLPLKHPWEESQTMPVKVKGENRVKKTVAIVTHCVQKIWLVQDMICIYVHKGRFHTPVTASLGFRPLHSPGRKSTNQDIAYLFVAQYKNMIGLNETNTITTSSMNRCFKCVVSPQRKDDHLH